jgi:Zn-dependent alcohol dehydrogenase|tara:strand:+ start:6929 stop:7069 length:141 start_codon:yes stop_codon:yes gene_type:complete
MAEFKHCEKCSGKKKELCAKFRTCLADKSGNEKKGDKKPVRKGTYG